MKIRPVPSILLAAALTVAACSSDDSSAGDNDESTSTTSAPITVPEPVDLVVRGPIEGSPQTSAAGTLEGSEYVEEEFFVSGTAVSFEADDATSEDGQWTAEESTSAPFTTRILVKRPADIDEASGVVVVEWNNVSAGMDGTPDWSYTSAEILRSGHVHVAVSAQEAGVEGDAGGGLGGFGAPLKTADPERYADLAHPGDIHSYDIFRQVGRLTRSEATEGPDPLGDLRVDHVIAIGESQSAFRLTTYVNAVQPLDPVYDGFLVHSRGGGAAPLDDTEGLASGISGAIRIRDDLDAPTLVFTTETDLTILGFAAARQPDTDSVVNWEVAGTAHADAYLLGGDPATGAGLGCTELINDGPQHLALKAALSALVDWVTDGTPPPRGPRIDVGADGSILRDDDGLATGGIRLPAVEVPSASLSGDPAPDASVICSLFGTTMPFGPEEMTARYGTVEDFLALVEDAVDEVIGDGFLLLADRSTALEEAAEVEFG